MVHRVLLGQVEQVARRVRKHGLKARGVSVKIRYGDFQTVTRSMTLSCPTDSTAELWDAATDRINEKFGTRTIRRGGVP